MGCNMSEKHGLVFGTQPAVLVFGTDKNGLHCSLEHNTGA